MIKIKTIGLDKSAGRKKLSVKDFDRLLESETTAIKAGMEVYTHGWSNPVTITSRKPYTRGGDRIAHAGASRKTKGNMILSYINFGTRRRSIFPKRPGGTLRFQYGYNAATRPGSTSSGRKSRYGKYVVTSAVHNHSIAARNFDEALAKKRKKSFEYRARLEINKIAKGIF